MKKFTHFINNELMTIIIAFAICKDPKSALADFYYSTLMPFSRNLASKFVLGWKGYRINPWIAHASKDYIGWVCQENLLDNL
jgi:hypothetical protein